MPKSFVKITKTIALILCFFFFTALNSKDYNTALQIKNPQNGKTYNFLVNIAKSEEQRQKGLMFVDKLPKNYGMIFEFENEQVIYMWMKNTKIPLDMLFIDKAGKIVSIKENAQIESLEIISSQKPVKKVLEINGGLTKKLGIKLNDLIII
ncbi:MAG: DUF192 domain-containing protein [Pseudomonadota bacterium]